MGRIIGAIVGVFALMVVFSMIVTIDAGERGVVLQWGAVSDEILSEGIHFIMPIRDKVEAVDVTIRKESKKASASSKDLQNVSSNVTINYKLDPTRVNKIYQTLRHEYDDRVIEPAIAEYVKKTTAQFTAEELITKRALVKEELRTALTANLEQHGIVVVDIFITDFNFSKMFNDAIEAKVEAEQKAFTAKNKLEEVKFQAEQKVATARAEAEAIRIKAQAVTQQGGKDYVQLQAIEKWNGVLPERMIPAGTVPFINLENK